MHANWLSNGLGGQSMFLLMLAAKREIPATISITADTGSENDRVCSTGERMTAPDFYLRFVVPYAERHGIEPLFIRSVDKNKNAMPPLGDTVRKVGNRADRDFYDMIAGLCVPMFTNDRTRGRLRQSCTDRWKVRAINQEAKRRGISVLRSAIGFHAGERHRVKARFLRDDGGFSIWKPQTNRKGTMTDIRWLEHYYPAIDLEYDREKIRAILQKEGLPYLITTECDFCPHQDYARWIMHTPEVIDDCARLEAAFQGKLFFTSLRIPLKQALEIMKQKEIAKQNHPVQGELPTFGCENGAYCGI